MDLILKHYEKLLLAFCLVCLVAGMLMVLVSLDRTSSQVKQLKAESEGYVNGGEMLKHEASAMVVLQQLVDDPRKQLNLFEYAAKDPGKGALLSPAPLVVCTGKGCGRLLPYAVDVCPYCKQKAPERAASLAADLDTDKDGIPDVVEKKYPGFLHYRNPRDAGEDYDKDGFSNLEEYQAGTKMDDNASFPRLANLLRCSTVTRQPIYVKLHDIDTNNRPDDKAKWDIVFDYSLTHGRGKWKKQTCQLEEGSERINKSGYKLVDARIEGEGEAAVKYAVIRSMTNEKEEYVLKVNEQPYKRELRVAMRYLDNRFIDSDQDYPLICKNEGDEFELVRYTEKDAAGKGMDEGNAETSRDDKKRKPATKPQGVPSERYRLLKADVQSKTCVVGYIEKSGGAVLAEIKVPTLDPAKDVRKRLSREEGENNKAGGVTLDDMMGPSNKNPKRGPGR